MTLLLKTGPERILQKEYTIIQPNNTEEEFWDYANEDTDCELIEGALYIHSPASEEHEDIFSYLNAFFRWYLEKNNLGKVYGSRFVMRLSELWNPEPDLMIVLTQHQYRIQKTKLEGPADLLIEILSPSTRELDLEKKLPMYLQSGVQEVWILDPENKSLAIHTKDRAPHVINQGDQTWISSTFLGTIPLTAHWIWARAQFPLHRIIDQHYPLFLDKVKL